MDDFKKLVAQTHELGMKLIIDWVPNHSAWDHPATISNPAFYLKDSTGNFDSPFDWTDVIRFDYDNPDLRAWMVDNMKFWLTEANIDGFRCDVAHMVPVEFWDSCRVELDKVKPIFFLAEAEQHWLHKKAFEMSYGWEFHHIMNEIAKGHKTARDIEKYYDKFDTLYPQGSILMQFTSNHDENTWAGTEFERMGDGAQAFAVLATTVPGMLLLYNGQESAFDRRLEFFVKDSITWGDYSYTDFYKNLIRLKKENKALWNGLEGGSLSFVRTSQPKFITAFMREKDGNRVLTFINLSNKELNVKIRCDSADGTYKNAFNGEEAEIKYKARINLKPWEYKVFVKE
jgi:glycosidase